MISVKKPPRRRGAAAALVLFGAIGLATVAAAAPAERSVGRYKLGAPYEAGGIWFVPAEDPSYDQTGEAGAYAEGVAGGVTANGETSDPAALTGAHATLPLPAIVAVTNLDNGRTLRLRVNDRGAPAPGRVLDLSPAAADRLGVPAGGAASVRVRYIGPARLDRPLEPLRPGRTVAKAPAPDGGYLVQAGAFSDPARAQQVARSLGAAGRAGVRPVMVAGRQLYRVVVGAWADPSAAARAQAQVVALGYGDARVVRAF